MPANWFVIKIGFCPSKDAWHSFFRQEAFEGEFDDVGYPSTQGCSQCFGAPSEGYFNLVTIADDLLETEGALTTLGVIAHESTHCFQFMADHIEEKSPSSEFAAYSTQAIFEFMVTAFESSGRGTLVSKAA